MAEGNYSKKFYNLILNRIANHRVYSHFVTYNINSVDSESAMPPEGSLFDANGDVFKDANGNYFVVADE